MLNRALTSGPVLARPDLSKQFSIQRDASGLSIVAVLTQEGDDREVLIVFISRMLIAPERNYSVWELECL